MMGLTTILLGGVLWMAQTEPPPPPAGEKPAPKASDEKAQGEKPAEGQAEPGKAPAVRPSLKPALLPARGGEGERQALSETDLKALHENNIFSPRRVKRTAPKSVAAADTAETGGDRQTKPRPPLVTGFIFDQKAHCHQVVLEDRNGPAWKLFREPKFLKEGDEVVGFRVCSVARDHVVLAWGDSTVEVKVGEAVPDIGFQVPDKAEGSPSPPPAKADAEAAPLDEGTKNKVLEELRGRYKKNRKEDP